MWLQTAHPYNFEDDDEVMAQRVAKVEQEEKMDLEKNAAPALMTLIAEKDKLLLQQAEEIGRLKAELSETKKHAERLAALVNTDSTAHVGW